MRLSALGELRVHPEALQLGEPLEARQLRLDAGEYGGRWLAGGRRGLARRGLYGGRRSNGYVEPPPSPVYFALRSPTLMVWYCGFNFRISSAIPGCVARNTSASLALSG